MSMQEVFSVGIEKMSKSKKNGKWVEASKVMKREVEVFYLRLI